MRGKIARISSHKVIVEFLLTMEDFNWRLIVTNMKNEFETTGWLMPQSPLFALFFDPFQKPRWCEERMNSSVLPALKNVRTIFLNTFLW